MSFRAGRIIIGVSNIRNDQEVEINEEIQSTLSEEPAIEIYSNPIEKINSNVLFEEYFSKISRCCELEKEL